MPPFRLLLNLLFEDADPTLLAHMHNYKASYKNDMIRKHRPEQRERKTENIARSINVLAMYRSVL